MQNKGVVSGNKAKEIAVSILDKVQIIESKTSKKVQKFTSWQWNKYGYNAEQKLLTIPFYFIPFVAKDLADGTMV